MNAHHQPRRNWALAIFAALPIPIHILCIAYQGLLTFATYDVGPDAYVGFFGPLVFAPLYALALQISVTRSAFRLRPTVPWAGMRVLMLNVRILFWLAIGAWLPIVEFTMVFTMAAVSWSQFGFSPEFIWYGGQIPILIWASFVLARGTRRVVRNFATLAEPGVPPLSGRMAPDIPTSSAVV